MSLRAVFIGRHIGGKDDPSAISIPYDARPAVMNARLSAERYRIGAAAYRVGLISEGLLDGYVGAQLLFPDR